MCAGSVVFESLRPPWAVCSPTRPLVPGILQARTLEWVVISFSNQYSRQKEIHICVCVCVCMYIYTYTCTV